MGRTRVSSHTGFNEVGTNAAYEDPAKQASSQSSIHHEIRSFKKSYCCRSFDRPALGGSHQDLPRPEWMFTIDKTGDDTCDTSGGGSRLRVPLCWRLRVEETFWRTSSSRFYQGPSPRDGYISKRQMTDNINLSMTRCRRLFKHWSRWTKKNGCT